MNKLFVLILTTLLIYGVNNCKAQKKEYEKELDRLILNATQNSDGSWRVNTEKKSHIVELQIVFWMQSAENITRIQYLHDVIYREQKAPSGEAYVKSFNVLLPNGM